MFDFRHTLFFPDSCYSRFSEGTEQYIGCMEGWGIELLQDHYGLNEDDATYVYRYFADKRKEHFGSKFLSFNLHYGQDEEQLLGTSVLFSDPFLPLTRDIVSTHSIEMPPKDAFSGLVMMSNLAAQARLAEEINQNQEEEK